jgi:hypothetical protein
MRIECSGQHPIPHAVFFRQLIAVVAALAAPAALGVTFLVNSTLDQPDDLTRPGVCHTAAGTCTLRAAVMQANRASAFAQIAIPAGVYKLTIAPIGSDAEDSGDLDFTGGASAILVYGADRNATIIDGNHIDRVFHIHAGRQVTLTNLTIRNGLSAGLGGGAQNDGTLILNAVTISGNQANEGGGVANILIGSNLTLEYGTVVSQNVAVGGGGGISNDTTLSMYDTTVSHNTAGASGGGMAQNGGSAYITRSTIANNSAGFNGGGIWNSALLGVEISTVSQNAANNNGGGLYNTGTGVANFYSSTIVFNGADEDADPGGGSGGGVFNYDPTGPTVNLYNTLLAGNNYQGAPVYDDCTGTINSYARNMFWTVLSNCTINNATGGAWTFFNSLSALGPLQNNGGLTPTHALLASANAIDAGDPVVGCRSVFGVIGTDQRNAPRVAGARCDIGAFEFGAASPPVVVGVKSRKTHGAAGTFDLSLGTVVLDPTTEPRAGPSHTIVFTFDKPISSAIAAIAEGTATASAPMVSGTDVSVGLTGVSDQQYVSVTLGNLVATDGGTGTTPFVRIGFLAGDVNQSRVVSLADLGMINAQLSQVVTSANYLKDVNASGTLTLADKGMTNANLTRSLPAP